MRVARRLPLVALIGAGLVAVATTSAAAPSSARSAAHPGGVIQPVPNTTAAINSAMSSNWFGYNLSGATRGALFTQVAGRWQVPKVTQHQAGKAEHSAAWIGIGGGCINPKCSLTDLTLIQTGTAHSVDRRGVPSYSAWFELIPGPALTTTLRVRPGDLLSADIRQVARGVWRIGLSNLTTRSNWATTVPYTSTYLTAEWITETPIVVGTGGTGLAALPNLTPVHFDNASLNGANPRLTGNDRIFLVSGGRIIGTPSFPQADGNGFAACTWTTRCLTPANY